MTADSGTSEMIHHRRVMQAAMDIASIQEGMAELSSKQHNSALMIESTQEDVTSLQEGLSRAWEALERLKARVEELEKGDYR